MVEIRILLELITNSITVLGIPVGVFLFFKEKKRERKDREYGTYNALDDKYIGFLELCLENTELDLFGRNKINLEELTAEQRERKYIIYEILICILERAFLMYREHPDQNRSRQWEGWKNYMTDWMNNETFREAWDSFLGDQYDKDFMVFMESVKK